MRGASEAPLEAGQPAGWRYLASDGTTVIASVESVVDTGGAQTFSQFNEGPFVVSTAEALATAPAHPAGRPGFPITGPKVWVQPLDELVLPSLGPRSRLPLPPFLRALTRQKTYY